MAIVIFLMIYLSWVALQIYLLRIREIIKLKLLWLSGIKKEEICKKKLKEIAIFYLLEYFKMIWQKMNKSYGLLTIPKPEQLPLEKTLYPGSREA